ncbi:MAG: YiiD C-terminal domain-containing protein [Actinobacteria bacterium]|nr:YiiD C-terminal domain-containing protein [Actinomycetota bacterium]
MSDALSPKALTEFVHSLIPMARNAQIEVVEAEPGRVKMMAPLAPNTNHVGIMYAGALFTLAELPGGVIAAGSFDNQRFYPIVRNLDISFRRPATTDITVEVILDPAEAARIMDVANAEGKANYSWECSLLDTQGVEVAHTRNDYQLRLLNT